MGKSIITRRNCPVCNSSYAKTIFKRSFNEKLIQQYMNVAYQGNANIVFLRDIPFEIVKCPRCSISYQKHILNEEGLNDLYNNWINPSLAEEWNQNNKILKSKYYNSILNFLKFYLNREPSSIKVLDYGAGFGDFLIVAKQSGFKTFAYEYSDERIRYLQNKGIDVINFDDKETFDFIILNQVLEHITYPHIIMDEISSKVKKNGLIFISIPNCNKIANKLRNINQINDPEEMQKMLLKASVAAFQHINFFTNSGVKYLFKYHQLKPINPFNQIFLKPITIKSVIRPFYRFFFGTSFFLTKSSI